MPASNIVITGAAIISPLGLTRESTFAAVLEGRCGMGKLSAMESPLPEGRDGGEAPPLPDDYEPALSRETRYLRRAIGDALADAGLSGRAVYPAERCGLMIGTTLHGMRAAGQFLRSQDYSHLARFLAAHVAQSAAAELGIGAFSATTCSACSSSLGSIALAVTMLESGEFDMVVAGGYDPVSEYVYAGFNSLRLVAEGPLKPFTRNREGMKLSEGYAIVILERAADAARRGARAFARIAGFGESADAHHLTQPHPQGEGARRAMLQAIAASDLWVEDIGLLVAHATGTPDNDAAEFAAMQRVFGERLPQVPCVAFKSHLGHTLGGAGAVEMILGAMAMQKQMVPPCANVKREEIEFAELNLVTDAARPAQIRAMLSTSLGFGGANTCIVLTPADSSDASATMRVGESIAPDRDAVITGIGVVFPGAVGEQQFLKLLTSASPALHNSAPTIAEEQIVHLINARRARRLSDYVKYMLAATTLALQDAGVSDVAAFAADCSAILGTTHGSSGYCEQYYRQIVEEGVLAANPMLFAEGVPNAASAHVSLMLGIRGGCQTIIGSRTSGLDALALAARRIQTGICRRVIVGASEEWSVLTSSAYGSCGMAQPAPEAMPFENASGFVTSGGSVVLLVESRKAAADRGARIRATVGRCASRMGKPRHHAGAVTDVMQAIGCPRFVLSSANTTWVDPGEAAGIERACASALCPPVIISSMYGHIAEIFSVTPLAGIAAALLTGCLPRLWGPGAATAMLAADGVAVADDFAVLCTDFTGLVSAARITPTGGLV